MTLLSLRDLRVTLDTPEGPAPILEGVGFDLPTGTSLGIVGESGCGKSMTALAIMGLLPGPARAEGEILFEGHNLLALPEAALCKIRGRRMAMVFQEPMMALNPVKTIGFQVAEGLRWHLDLSRGAAESRAVKLLDRVGLPQPRFAPDLYPHQLSGGQRQRVVIAMALACDPALLIADEPTTALDVTSQAAILDLLAEVAAEAGLALLLITHDLAVVWQNTRNMLVMYAGRVVERGPTHEVFARMAHPYTRGLLAASPGALDAALPPGRRLATIPGQVPDPLHRPAGCVFAGRCPRAAEDCLPAPPEERHLGVAHSAACLHPHLEAVQT
ncbi:MAG: ABC transporter ATP-binding protein [Kiloniellaceae bacterium]